MKRVNRKSTALVFIVPFILFCSQAGATASTGKVKVKETHQTMEGFGAAVAFYEGWLTAHPNKNDIYSLLFEDLGLDILRLRNTYRYNPNNFAPDASEIVNMMYQLAPNQPKILLSSWTPPADIKSNNSLNGGNNATLKKDATGKFMYGAFAKYWVDALDAYASIGINPDFISLQNEPSYDASWESCRFEATQTSAIAGYDRALDSVYAALQAAGLQTKIIGPEVHGIGYNTFQNYAQRFKHELLHGYAYHLYHGESGTGSDNQNPDLFNSNLAAIAKSYTTKPIFQTEYDRGDWLNTVWLMQNCLVRGNVSAYFYWSLVWTSESGKALVRLEFPWDQSRWTTPQGYILPTEYWAFRQFSKFIDAGWKRVTTESDDDSLRVSAFIDPDGVNLAVVVVNIGKVDRQMGFDLQEFTVTSGQVIRTSESEQGEEIDSNYNGTSSIAYPARSITTLSVQGQVVSAVDTKATIPLEFSLSQNYPNPFNPATRIEYSIATASFVKLKVYDILGREVKTLVNQRMPAGKQAAQLDARDLHSGIYIYQISAGKFVETKRMVLVK